MPTPLTLAQVAQSMASYHQQLDCLFIPDVFVLSGAEIMAHLPSTGALNLGSGRLTDAQGVVEHCEGAGGRHSHPWLLVHCQCQGLGHGMSERGVKPLGRRR